jgi:CPA1 family monovalent cation:H+ antiporter
MRYRASGAASGEGSVVQSVVVFLLGAFTLALIAEPLARVCRLPYTSLLVVLGIVAGQLVEAFGVDTGLDYVVLTDVVLKVLLPVLIYEAAQTTDLALLRRYLLPVLLLVGPGFLVATFASAALIAALPGVELPWLPIFVVAALLASTDSLAVTSQLGLLDAPERLRVTIEGEGMLNDPAAIVLFSVVSALAVSGVEPTVTAVALDFLTAAAGGVATGLAFGSFGWAIFRILQQDLAKMLCTLAIAYASFLTAEALGASGVFATLAAALLVDVRVERFESPALARSLDTLWRVLGYVASAVLFLLVGFAFTREMFAEHFAEMAVAVVAVLLARAVAVFGLLSLPLGDRSSRLPLAEQTVVVWGGLRGGVALALALSLPLSLESWFTLQSMAYGVVLFTLLVQAPTLPWLLRRAVGRRPHGDVP